MAREVNFENAIPGFDEFFFLTRDCNTWLVASKDSVIGEAYGPGMRPVVMSSVRDTPHSVKWYNREI